MFCPECKVQLADDTNVCHICGHEIESDDWMVIGAVKDQITADYARVTLEEQGIPAVVSSLSGFFGSAGLTLYPFFDTKTPLIEISVPVMLQSQAVELLNMTLGDRWYRKEE